jgi:hypothetical protein
MSDSVQIITVRLSGLRLSLDDCSQIVVDLLKEMIGGTFTDETGNRTIAMIAEVCVDLNLAASFALRYRRLVLNPHWEVFNPFRVTDLKSFSN